MGILEVFLLHIVVMSSMFGPEKQSNELKFTNELVDIKDMFKSFTDYGKSKRMSLGLLEYLNGGTNHEV